MRQVQGGSDVKRCTLQYGTVTYGTVPVWRGDMRGLVSSRSRSKTLWEEAEERRRGIGSGERGEKLGER